MIAFVFSAGALWAQGGKPSAYTSIDYPVAAEHEIEPHRRTIPVDGVRPGFNQLRLALTISPAGDVIDADAGGDAESLKFWAQVEPEVLQWKFVPFEADGKPTTAKVEEYVDLVPPERFPAVHVAAPALRPTSKVSITLERTGCFGSCPAYVVTVSTDGIEFNGSGWVVASGKHKDSANADAVRDLAKRFISADFYSMDSKYVASVTDNPAHILSIAIDGHEKRVVDYVGEWVGMPEVITELEDAVDTFARTERWIKGTEGLVQELRAEGFDFQTFAAQTMLKEAAIRGRASTVRELLEAGVPLEPVPAPKPPDPDMSVPFEGVGWLTAASSHADVLRILMDAGASKNDQSDKDLALAGAANAGNLEGARELIAYGANPNADLRKKTVVERGSGMILGEQGAESILIYAAESGDPAMVREILRYHPRLEARDREGKTAMFAAGDSRNTDKDGARVECVRLLAQAGANVNARDNDGDTPLHETFLTDVEEELLKLGANVNARNNDGETPIFTTVDDDAIPLFIKYGADLTIRNNKGETVIEAAKEQGPQRREALRKAIQEIHH